MTTALTASQYRTGASVAQAIVAIYDRSLQVDGKWGKFSTTAYNKLGGAQQAVVNNSLSGAVDGATVADLVAFRDREKSTAAAMKQIATTDLVDGRYVSRAMILETVARVGMQLSVDPDMLMKFIDLEAATVIQNGSKMYDTRAVNALGYRGLGQFDRNGAAWTVASRITPLPPFESAWADPYYSTLAIAAYIRANTITIRKLGYKGPITANVAYLMHNQGAGGAYKYLTGQSQIVGKQSAPAMAVALQARKDGLTALA